MKKQWILGILALNITACAGLGMVACDEGNGDESYDGTPGLEFYTDSGDAYHVTGYTGTETEVVVPAMYKGKPVNAIGSKAFVDTNVTKITLPDGITKIAMYAFQDSDSLTEINLPDSLHTIDRAAFQDCDGLAEIILPESLKTIAEWAFSDCDSLTEINLPGSLERLFQNAFTDCDKLTSITYNGTMAQWSGVKKNWDWSKGSPATELVCLDGSIDL